MAESEAVAKSNAGLLALFQICWDYLKFYQELLMKTVLGYLGITGAVLAFWIAHPEFKLAIWGLMLPIILGLAIAVFCFYAIYKKWPQNNDECVQEILNDLELGKYSAPSSESYVFMLWLIAIVTLVISTGCFISILIACRVFK
jgi:hypothetical protein